VRRITATVEAQGMTTIKGTDTPTDVLALLPLPGAGGLSAFQIRGKSCVWCAGVLASGAVVDLGPRVLKNLDTRTQWFPRSCRPCVAKRANRALVDHAPKCEQCVDDAANCETGRALYRLIRENRR
jgi:hypothetical protein